MENYLLRFVSMLVLIAIVGGAYYFGTQKSTPNIQKDLVTSSPLVFYYFTYCFSFYKENYT